MFKKFSLAAACAIVLLAGCTAVQNGDAEKFTVNNVYGSHMVLQRHKPIVIAGTALPGRSVKVTIGKNAVNAVAGKDGNWKAVLPELPAGGPYTVTVSGKGEANKVVFSDVLVGEVWFCSGQSNMAMPVAGRRFWCSANGHKEAAEAKYPRIRIFQVSDTVSPGVEKRNAATSNGWEVCSPDTIGKFSACGYYFGRALHKELDVPVGLVDSSWGGTRIEPWISKAGFESGKRSSELESIKIAEASDVRKAMESVREASRIAGVKWLKGFYKAYEKESARAADWKNSSIDTSSWKSVSLSNQVCRDLGVFWFRKDIDVPAECAGKPLKVCLGAIDDVDESFFNGAKIGEVTVDDAGYWEKVRIYTVPGKLVKAGKNTICVRVSNLHGAGGFSGEAYVQTCNGKKSAITGNWLMKTEFVASIKKVGERPSAVQAKLDNKQFPATLYNAMVNPWIVYPMRGFIWYQGCANAGNARDYMVLHPLLISDWRAKWGDDSMPFIFAQLAAFERHTPAKRLSMEYLKTLAPTEHGFSALREVQAATLSVVPNTGMGVSIDIGDHSDIHPANKQDLAYRMAKEAMRIAYGYKGVTSGPAFKSVKFADGKARVSFTGTGSGLVVRGGKLNCFSIAGKDGKFVWADAVLDGDTVVVSSAKVKEPVAVRYAWAPYPIDPNLYNKEGFPAIPFRSDKPDYIK